jgi:hypothetical protein
LLSLGNDERSRVQRIVQAGQRAAPGKAGGADADRRRDVGTRKANPQCLW